MCIYLRRLGLIALLAIVVPAALAAPQRRSPVLAHVRAESPVRQQPALPTQNSAAPPQVTYSNGLLAISAPNSTLGDVLEAVKAQTGASLQIPPSAAQERVAVQLGPGTPRDVLSQLLDGSPFDYILLGSAEQPDALTQIILTPHSGRSAGSATMQAPPPPPPQSQPAEDESDNEPAAQAPQPVPGPPMPPEQNQPPEESGPPNGQPGQQNRVKTPEQLLRELQQLQRQEQLRRQQQQQQQNRPPQ